MLVDLDGFERVLDGVRGRRGGGGFDLVVASEEEVRRAEVGLGVELPGAYREFMTRYGGGQFLFVDLVRVEELVAVNRNEDIPAFVAVAPVGTGDWWGFEVQDGVCRSAVCFWFHDDGTLERQHAGFFEFLVHQGLMS